MNIKGAKQLLEEWEKHQKDADYPNLFITDLLEAQKIVERERCVEVIYLKDKQTSKLTEKDYIYQTGLMGAIEAIQSLNQE